MNSTLGQLDRLPWKGLLAAAAVLALLMAFHQVVQGSVRQSEFRRQADAALADASLRCMSLRGAETVRQCLANLQAATDRTSASRFERSAVARPAVLPRLASLSDGARDRLAPHSLVRQPQAEFLRGLPPSSE